jgi:uncharacterized repeat protein (TIGR02543 family)
MSRRLLLLAALCACLLVAGPAPLAGASSSAYTLRVFVNGNGSVQGSGIKCGAAGDVCGVSYALGTTITIQAQPAQFSVFAGWTGACTGIGDTCTMTAGDPTTVTASFSYIEVVDVNMKGDGKGTVVSTPSGVTCPGTCSAPYTGNTRVELVPRAAAGSKFVGWSDGYCKGTGTCVLQQAYGTMAVTAEFEPTGWKPGSTTVHTGSGGGGSGSGGGSSAAFAATSQGASARPAANGRLITVKLSVNRSAKVRLQIWNGKKLISEAKLNVQAGPVTVRLPFSNGYKAGEYDLWAYVFGQGENPKKPKLLHWKVQIP